MDDQVYGHFPPDIPEQPGDLEIDFSLFSVTVGQVIAPGDDEQVQVAPF